MENSGNKKPLPSTFHEFAAEQRKFLHDLSNPLAIASGMLEAYRDEFDRSGLKASEALTRKIEKVEQALERLATLVREHRPRLIEIQEKYPEKE